MKEIYSRTIFIILVTIILLASIYICLFKQTGKTISISKINSNKKDTSISNDIRIGIIAFDTINPILSKNKNIQDISRLIFDPLFTLTKDYKLEGVLAKEITKISDKTYVIKLNENIYWHDGKKFNSSDVIFTINILKKLKEDSIYYYNVKNIELVQEIDEYIIKIITNIDISYFEYNLIFPIISSKYFNEENIKLESKNISPVGTGMFYISDVNNTRILLKKNLENINSKELKVETITLKLYTSLVETIEAFKTENIDIFISSNKNIDKYLYNINYNIKDYINRQYNYLALNCNSEILSQKEVRHTINYAINKEEILKEIFVDKYKVSNFPLDFRSDFYVDNNEIIKYEPDKSKKLLLDNNWEYSLDGWEKNNLNIKLKTIVNKNNIEHIKIVYKIKEQLNTVGILLDIKEVNQKEYTNYINDKNYDIIFLNNTYGYSLSLEKYFGKDNLANYNNNEINNILGEIIKSDNENDIKEEYTKIVKIYNEDVPYISLYYDTSSIIYSKNLRGSVTPNSYNLFLGIESWYREYEK